VSWSALTWDTARAGGFLAYVLLTLGVAVGLVLKNRWQSTRWPRLVTNELHGYLNLLALVFVTIHVLAVLVDPFTRFGLAEVLVPLVSHYRPLWMGLGIVALYLLLAVWVSTKLRARIGYRAWRGIHLLAYGVWGAATVHGLGTGSDTQTAWAPFLYSSSVALVGLLLVWRLVAPAGREQARHPWIAAAGGAAVVLLGVWALVGPLAPHWGARAGGTSGSLAASSTRARGASSVSSAQASGVVPSSFNAHLTGTATVQPVDQAGRVTIRIDGALHGATRDHLEIYIRGVPIEGGGVSMEQSRVRLGAATPLYQGTIVALQGNELVASVSSATQHLRLGITLQLPGDGTVSGDVRGSAGSGSL